MSHVTGHEDFSILNTSSTKNKPWYEKAWDWATDFDFGDEDTGLVEDVLGLLKTKDKQGVAQWDPAKIAASGTGLASLLGFLPEEWTKAEVTPQGYQGVVPRYTASRRRVPGTYDPTRRPGSGGQRYFTDVAYTPEGGTIPDLTAQADALKAANLANLARETIPAAPTPPSTDKAHFLSDFVKTGTGVPTNPAIPDITIDRTVTGRTDVPEIGTPEYRDWVTTEYNKLPTLRRGGAVADIVKAFQSGALVEMPQQQELSGPEIANWVRNNVESDWIWRLSDAEILQVLDATTDMMGMKMAQLGKKAGGRIRSGIASIMANEPYTRSFDTGGGIANMTNQFSTNLSPRPNSKDTFQGRMPSRYLNSAKDGMADTIPATIDNKDPAALSGGEFVVAADVVSGLGNGNSEAGAKQLYDMMDRIRKARTGTIQQGKQINPQQYMPA
tara:strand:- start:10522 stop:11847 length:1326 start_codon:yes stop_codon:yes gene_type:complete